MSKIVVDQIQKSGGPALTLPTTSAGAANSLLVAGTDQALGFTTLGNLLPSGTAGQVLTTAGGGNLAFSTLDVSPTGSGVNMKTHILYDSVRDGSVGSVKLMWSDLGITDITKIENVEIKFSNIASSAACTIYNYFQNSSGADITSGYLGYSGDGNYNGNQTSFSSHNSNSGYFWFPLYSSMAYNGYSYGAGLTGRVSFHPVLQGSYGRTIHGIIGYHQNTSYSYPNTENFCWDRYDTNTPTATAYGIRLYPSSGSFNAGSIIVRVTYRA